MDESVFGVSGIQIVTVVVTANSDMSFWGMGCKLGRVFRGAITTQKNL